MDTSAEKMHTMIEMNSNLKRQLERLKEWCVEHEEDINIPLTEGIAGLLQPDWGDKGKVSV